MSFRLGDAAPVFTQDSTEGEINFYQFLGDSWGVLFSHPKDFKVIRPHLRMTPQSNRDN